MSTQNEGPVKSFIAGEALEQYRRVKLDSSGHAVYADAGEVWIGVTQTTAAITTDVAVRLKNAAGTMKVVAAGAVSARAMLYGAADGKVDDTKSGEVQFYGLEAATADGDIIEAVPWSLTGDRFTSVDDSNGNEAIEIAATADAVNHLKATNAATGASAALEAAGDDTNVGLDVKTKGTGAGALVGDDTDVLSWEKDTNTKLAFFGETRVVQQSHIADPAAMASVTQEDLTDSSGGTGATTIAEITNTANVGSADVAPVANAIAGLAAQLAKIKVDVAAAKSAVDANNTAIDSVLAAFENYGLLASS